MTLVKIPVSFSLKVLHVGGNNIFGTQPYGTLYQKNQELVYEFLPLLFIIPSSSSSGILNPKAKSAVAVDQKAARLICIFSATSRAHPKSLSATMQGILSLSDPLIFSMSSSSFPGMTWKIDSVDFPNSFLSSQGSNPSGIETRYISNMANSSIT
ncbi:hypothetical protein ACSBR1_010510 [Camellia fascicularis]